MALGRDEVEDERGEGAASIKNTGLDDRVRARWNGNCARTASLKRAKCQRTTC